MTDDAVSALAVVGAVMGSLGVALNLWTLAIVRRRHRSGVEMLLPHRGRDWPAVATEEWKTVSAPGAAIKVKRLSWEPGVQKAISDVLKNGEGEKK